MPHNTETAPLDDQEIHTLVTTWTGRLVLFARQWVNLPDDVVQDVFLKLCELQKRPDDVVAWLFREVRSTAINCWKSEQARIRRENTVALTNPEWFQSSDESRLDGETVKEKLQELPQELREVVIARIWGELTLEQIATLTDSARTTTRRRYYEAIELLRKHMGIGSSDGRN